MTLLLDLHNAVREVVVTSGFDARPSEAVFRAMVVRVTALHPELADLATDRIGDEGGWEARAGLIDHANRLMLAEEQGLDLGVRPYRRSEHHAIQLQALAPSLIASRPGEEGWLYQTRLKMFAVHAAFALVADTAPAADVFEALGDVTLTLYGAPVAVPPREEQPSP